MRRSKFDDVMAGAAVSSARASKSDHRFQLFLLACLWIFLGYLYVLVGPGVMFSNLSDGGGEDGEGRTQQDFKASLARDKEALAPGSSTAHFETTVDVGKPFNIELAVCGTDVQVCRSNGPHRYSAAETTDLEVGARIKVELMLPPDVKLVSGKVEDIRPVMPGDDGAHWYWMLKASRPGEHEARIQSTPLRGGAGEEALGKTATHFIAVTSRDTAATKVARTGSGLNSVLATGGGAVAALVASAVGFLVYRHNKVGAQPSNSRSNGEVRHSDADTSVGHRVKQAGMRPRPAMRASPGIRPGAKVGSRASRTR
jgi:hypothetical protein